MTDRLKIVIPSYGRPGNVTALKNIDESIQRDFYYIAVRPEEEQAYVEAYPHANVVALTGDVDGVTPTRQRINEQFEGKIIVIDDDVKFQRTRIDLDKSRHRGHKYCIHGNGRLTTYEDYSEMSDVLCKEMETNPFGGLMSLGFKQDARKYPNQWNRPIIWAVWFNLDLFDPYRFDYTNGPEFIEDVYMSIIWFDEGNDFPCMTGPFAITKTHGTGDQGGGCNAVEDRSKSHNASAKWLEDNYPQYCWRKLSPKYHKTMGAPTHTVECKLMPHKRKTHAGEYMNKPPHEFQIDRRVGFETVYYKEDDGLYILDPEYHESLCFNTEQELKEHFTTSSIFKKVTRFTLEE